MHEATLISRFALQTEPDPRSAAAACLGAGIVLLAFCQSLSPIPNTDEMLDETFAELRKSFHEFSKPKTMDA